MGRRRKQNTSSSLDLFLDTICNAFGGIMFLSILISLLLQMRSDESGSETTPMLTAEEFHDLQTEIERLSGENDRMVQSIQLLHDSLNSTSPENHDQTRLKLQIDKERKEISDNMKARDTLTKQLGALTASNLTMEKQLREAGEEMTRLEAKLERSSLDLEKAVATRTRSTELPKTKSTSKANVLLGLRYGKLYLISNLRSGKFSADRWNKDHVLDTSFLGVTRIRMRQDAGLPVEHESFAANASVLLRNVSAEDYFMSIAVWPDSYEQFETVKQYMIARGFEYDLLPLGDVDAVSIASGGAATVQ